MDKTYAPVTTAQELTEALAKCRAAQEKFATYTQEQVDKIFLAAATAANQMRIPLAKQAVAETGMGVVEDKVIKNHYAAEYIYNAYKDYRKQTSMAEAQAALDQGIPVLSVDTDVGIEGQTTFVGTSNVDAAYEGGKWAIEQAGTDAKAVIIYGQEGDNTSNMRREGYQKACDEAGVEVLAALSGQNTTDGATKTMEDLLNAYPDQIDIVLCHNDDTAIGAMNACKSAGVSDMIIVGFDGNQSAVDLILAGEMVKATVAQQPYEMGYQAVEAALKAIKGESVDAVINAPVTVVTAENGQEYLDSLASMQG